MPTRALSPYIFFVKDMRKKVVAENPNFKATQIMSKLGELWRGLSDDDKAKYNKLAAIDKIKKKV
jgi:hypothetical protein